MTFTKKAVTGMRDILPGEARVRAELKAKIRKVYTGYGFTEIETPVIEHIENLTSKQGGENEKLIFKILKRGEKLKSGIEKIAGTANSDGNREISGEYEEILNGLTEEGLRYDLTLPLARYYSANIKDLPQPFKAFQTGPVFRADRPQKGRFRQFEQCDIDILGDPTNLAEKELILAASDALSAIGFDKYEFYIVINDRRFLFELLKYAGFSPAGAGDILITLDKADKIGPAGVDEELKNAGYSEESVNRLREVLSTAGDDSAAVRIFGDKIGSPDALSAAENVAGIMDAVTAVRDKKIVIRFDPALVRGMGYYTGTIFEIRTGAFGSSVGGGGRYDKMIGKFTGTDTPAVGFSIGFERIMSVITEGDLSGFTPIRDRSAWLIEKGMPDEKLGMILNEASKLRAGGGEILTVWMAKNKKFQKENLTKAGYTKIREFFIDRT